MVSDMYAMSSYIFNLCDVRMRMVITLLCPGASIGMAADVFRTWRCSWFLLRPFLCGVSKGVGKGLTVCFPIFLSKTLCLGVFF